jgi:hypothetical protein
MRLLQTVDSNEELNDFEDDNDEQVEVDGVETEEE